MLLLAGGLELMADWMEQNQLPQRASRGKYPVENIQ
jgi:hypothetical protein